MVGLLLALNFVQALSGPASVMVGDPVFLRLASGVVPSAGVAVRVSAPATEMGTVLAYALNFRESPNGAVHGVLFRGDRVLIKSQTGDGWCEAIAAHGGTGFVACDYLERAPYGQPLGTTDIDGRVVALNLALVPGPVTVMAGGASFTIAVLPFTEDTTVTIAPGITSRTRRWVQAGEGLLAMQIVEVSRGEPNVFVLPVRARDRAAGVATTSSMARRYGAVAAVNGGPFGSGGWSAGMYQIDEQVLAGNLMDRSALLRCQGGDLETAVAPFRGSVTAGNATKALTGVNRARSAADLILYRSGFTARTGTGADGVEVLLDAGGTVLAVQDGQGNAEIPTGGQVLSGSGENAEFLRQTSRGSLTILTSPVVAPGCSAIDVVGGGPRLVTNGRVDLGDDGFGNDRLRWARTAFAVTSRNTWLFVTVDGGQASSQGMRLDEFAAALVDLGAVRAVNLDGGASTTMVVDDSLRNAPSGGAERAVSDGVLIFSVHDLESLRRVMDRVALDPGQIDAGAIEPLYQHYDAAVAAFAADELEGLRSEIEALGAEVERRSGGEVTPAAARVLGEAVNAYLRLLPGIQQQLSRRVGR